MQATPGITKRQFIYAVSRSSYEKEWGANYEKPGAWSRFLAFLFRIVPKVGPFKALAFHAPTAEAEKLFMAGFVKTLAGYQEKLAEVKSTGKPALPNANFDVGTPSHFGAYRLADEASNKLLIKLDDKKFSTADPDLRKELLRFYGKQEPKDPKAAAALADLRAAA